MLHTEAIEPGTLSLLTQLMQLESLQPFSLVGGTALALRFGHRTSIDLDLFYNQSFDVNSLVNHLENVFGNAFSYKENLLRFGIFGFISTIKIDLVYYPHPIIQPAETIQSIRFYSLADISAMKIQAILGRGKKKDFWDIHQLLQHFSLDQIIQWHQEKYPSQMLAISIPHALTWFPDAEETEAPVSLKGQTWDQVKSGIQKAVRDYLS